jgi:hypothetical protein
MESRSAVSGEEIKVLDYHDGTLAFSTDIGAVSGKQACIDQGKIVDNKRPGTTLNLSDERENQGKRERSKNSHRRNAQVRAQDQLRLMNPIVADLSLFVASSER